MRTKKQLHKLLHNLSGITLDLICNNDRINKESHRYAREQLRLGNDEILTEEDPRYQQYWDLVGHFQTLILIGAANLNEPLLRD